ncbi:MAG TPA: protein kinase [Polyangiaceae bacterium]|nr:protein kinase [Polyangiaceae bacterium]
MLEIGQVLHEKYRIDRLVGKGGMGQVFEGFHLLIGRRVAIKILLPEVAASEAGNARFAAEARAAASINNPHILDVLDAGALPDGSRFMVSEFLDGEPLEARVSRGRLTAEETAVITLQLLDGLAAAHRAGITHRDLKPDNIFLSRKTDRHDLVKIIDFGISKFAPSADEAARMTTTGVVLGTPQYFSPEQARGERTVDPRSDLYSVGAIMYRCVAGHVPFAADTIHALLFRIALQNAPPLAAIVRGLDPAFSALTEKAMAKDPAARFQTADEMSHALKVWLDRSHRGAEARADTLKLASESDGTSTSGAVPLPTSDSFELAGMTPPFAGQARKRVTLVVALGLGVLLVGAILLTLRRPLSSAPGTIEDTSSRAPAPSAPTSQNAAAADTPLAPSSEPSAPNELPPAAPTAPKSGASDGAASASNPPSAAPPTTASPARKPAQRRSHPSEAQRPSSSAAPPAPKPSATAHPRRDFGY